MVDMANHPNRSKTCRPREHLRAATHFYPQAWKQIDYFRAGRGKELPDWPEWCFCPLSGAYAVVSGGGDNRCTPDIVGDIARIGALSAWRMTQSIYRFDPALYPRLIDTPIKKIPVEILYHLPEWCVYIETPDLQWIDRPLAGFFAHLEYDTNTGRSELRLLLDVDEPDGYHLIGQPLHLTSDTLDGAVQAMLNESKRQMADHGMTHALANMPEDLVDYIAPPLEPLLSLLLYLCSEAADFGSLQPPRNPAPKKTKKGWRLFPASTSIRWDVGVRIGAALRQAYLQDEKGYEQQGSGRARPRAHVRRAHWHSYWTGPYDGDRQIFVKWVPPISVNMNNLDDLPTIIKKVKE